MNKGFKQDFQQLHGLWEFFFRFRFYYKVSREIEVNNDFVCCVQRRS